MDTHATTGAAFALNIAAWCAKAKKDVNKASRAIVFEVFKRVIMRTPVDTGALRGNWQVGVNNMPGGQLAGASRDRSLSGLNVLKNQEVVGNVIFLVNNLPYAGVAEYGGWGKPPGSANGPRTVGGYSRQAPAGMVRVTVQEISDAVNTAMRAS